jgi:hypothetical protein
VSRHRSVLDLSATSCEAAERPERSRGFKFSDLPADAKGDGDQFCCSQAVGFGNRRGVDVEIAGFGKELHFAVAVDAAQTVGEAQAEICAYLV